MNKCVNKYDQARSESTQADVTLLLQEYAEGSSQALDRAFSVVYNELRGMARQQLRRSSVGNDVQATALVHEAYEKLAQGRAQAMVDRRHFFAIASRAMRQIVVDTYRADNAAKRGGGKVVATSALDELMDLDSPDRMVALHTALETLATQNSELAEVVDLACFGGLPLVEIAELHQTTVRTVQRQLKRAQAWLLLSLQND